MIDALIFDSGAGGLSVSADIRRRMPWLSLGYVCDNAALPYGTKDEVWLLARIVAVCIRACQQARPRALVVACNTASTLALEALRARLSIPVIGTVPAIKPAAEMTRSRAIGLLATHATVHRPYLDRLIADHAPDCRVVRVAADALVIEAEHRLQGRAVDLERLHQAVEPLRVAPDVDVVVLGCTHFPLLRDCLAPLMPPEVAWIDSGQAIARRLESVLANGPMTGVTTAATGGAVEESRLGRGVTRMGFDFSWATAATVQGLAAALARYGYAPPAALEVASPKVP
ncbi:MULTISPECIES: glutamate racemase [Salinicola]|uniref:Glutamate racemase n=1 Tax=Salinicola socius TaxID=404433 RepID=A0A1Q8SSD4_9GAMM|nr:MULTISPECIES: glutamate racemase [Salinicola]OLO04334.1 glutamate racemase [Salinicola socius]